MAKATILIVDDHLRDFDLIVDVLSQQDYLVKSATSGWSAITLTETAPPDLILLDIEMPGMSGYEVCEQLKNNPQTQDIPIIFVSVSDQLFDKVKAFSVGGADYISKPYQIEELLARVNTHLALRDLKKDLIKKNQELENEITKRKALEQLLEKMVHTDYLTKALNRRYFLELAAKEIERAQHNDSPIAMIILDIDHFNEINDTHGHLIGDRILRNLANLCQTKIREGDIFARYGGEEFVLLMPNTKIEAAQKTAERIREAVFHSFMVTGRANVLITISLGISGWDGNGKLIFDDLLDKADLALFEAKEMGRNRVIVWEDSLVNKSN